ncbi:MAG: hypothetical protein ACPGUZ_03390 [Holosporaceae bacterium]
MMPLSMESSRLLLSLVQKRCAQKTISESERTQLRSAYDVLLNVFMQKENQLKERYHYTRRIKQHLGAQISTE